jgi:hypothetical protein
VTIDLSNGKGTLERGDDDKWIVKSDGKTYTITVKDDGCIASVGGGSRLKKNKELCEAVESALYEELKETLSPIDDIYGDVAAKRGKGTLTTEQNAKRLDLYKRMFQFIVKNGNSEELMQILRDYHNGKFGARPCETLAAKFDTFENPTAEFEEVKDDFADLLA